MSRYLVLLNAPIGEGAVPAELRRLHRGGAAFHLLVPIVRSAADGCRPAGRAGRRSVLERSFALLHEAISRLRSNGFDVIGSVAAITDPVAAIEQAVAVEHCDGVVVVGGRVGLARWLKLDLRSRIDRRFDGPVIAVEPEPETALRRRAPAKPGRRCASAAPTTTARLDPDPAKATEIRARVVEARRFLDRAWFPDVDRYQLEQDLMGRFGFDSRQAGVLLAERSAAARIEAHGLGGHGPDLEAIVNNLIFPAAIRGSG